MADAPWIEWHGGECPVPDDTHVHFRTRFELANVGMAIKEDDNRRADTLRWSDTDDDDDIRAYRLAGDHDNG